MHKYSEHTHKDQEDFFKKQVQIQGKMCRKPNEYKEKRANEFL